MWRGCVQTTWTATASYEKSCKIAFFFSCSSTTNQPSLLFLHVAGLSFQVAKKKQEGDWFRRISLLRFEVEQIECQDCMRGLGEPSHIGLLFYLHFSFSHDEVLSYRVDLSCRSSSSSSVEKKGIAASYSRPDVIMSSLRMKAEFVACSEEEEKKEISTRGKWSVARKIS